MDPKERNIISVQVLISETKCSFKLASYMHNAICLIMFCTLYTPSTDVTDHNVGMYKSNKHLHTTSCFVTLIFHSQQEVRSRNAVLVLVPFCKSAPVVCVHVC